MVADLAIDAASRLIKAEPRREGPARAGRGLPQAAPRRPRLGAPRRSRFAGSGGPTRSAGAVFISEGSSHGTRHRHRRPPQRGEVHPLQRAARHRPGGGRQLPVLHHRAEPRRGAGAGPAARRPLGPLRAGEDHPDHARVHRHRRAGGRRLQGRGARQPVPRHHPRGRRHRPRAALLRRPGRHPRGRQGRPALATATWSRPS